MAILSLEVHQMNNVEKVAAIYIRVSTEYQAEEGYSIDAQKERLEAYCVSKGIKNYEFYIDGGFSGSNIERPEMQRLIADTKKGKISHVIVYKLDRLSRSQKDTLYLIEDVFNPHNADFVSINESMDTSSPMGRLMLGILSAFAQLERENIKERTRMGMLERVKSGLWMGGGRVPFGYDYDREQGILVPNKDAETVRKIYDLYLRNYSANKIANMLGLKYDKLVTQIIDRKSNIGIIEYNGVEYKGKHEPLIDEDTFYKAQQIRQDKMKKAQTSSGNLLTGIVYCGHCGAKMRYQNWGNDGKHFTCYSKQSSKPYLVKDPDCDNDNPRTNDVEEVVIADLFQFALEIQKITDNEKRIEPEELLEAQIRQISEKIKRLYNIYASDGNELLLETIKQNQEEMATLQSQLKLEQERGQIKAKLERVKEDIKNLQDVWEHMNIEEKRNVIFNSIERVEYYKGKINIKYAF